ncbi:unnamed protein product [Soboliphyme baturini]|uniref:Small ribosomal subunit protein mS33 n=1 Tax=Soboliphyme baturini TaxID=241478 RepID=A0A183ILM8_9BILA|nr:unnamed protein product [Soboliphyme baturini]
MAAGFKKVQQISAYRKHMERLSSKIFGDYVKISHFKDKSALHLLERLPLEENEYKVDYYIPHPMFHYLAKMLRIHGLFRDEHQDFQEEMRRLAILRGKSPPKFGQGKISAPKKETI